MSYNEIMLYIILAWSVIIWSVVGFMWFKSEYKGEKIKIKTFLVSGPILWLMVILSYIRKGIV